MEELYLDFQTRTQIEWIKDKGIPKSFKDSIKILTNYHVGYVCSILGAVNIQKRDNYNADVLSVFMNSAKVISCLSQQRATPSEKEIRQLTQEERRVFFLLLQGIETDIEEAKLYRFIKCGWLIQDNQNRISIPCPVFIDVIYNEYFKSSRPKTDNYGDEQEGLAAFMQDFLKELRAETIINSLSNSVNKKHLLEAFWCHEFYRIGSRLLREDTYLHTQVQQVDQKKIQGKVDYVLKNGNRSWVLEFLINGYSKQAEEHQERFRTNYISFSKYLRLLVDFRNSTHPIDAKKYNERAPYDNYWIVYYHISDFGEVELTLLTQKEAIGIKLL